MSIRKQRLKPEQMNEPQIALYDVIAKGKRASESAFSLIDEEGALSGPFDALLLQPIIGEAIQAVGAALRFNSRLPDRAREIAILLVAHFRESDFEVYAHEAVGQRVGLTREDLRDLAECKVPSTADEVEGVVANVVMELLQRGDLSDASYESTVRLLGEPVLFEVCTIVGYYNLLATQLKVFGHDEVS